MDKNINNNGQWKVRVDEFRGYVRGRIEGLTKISEEQKDAMVEVKKYLGELKEAFVERPQNCPINDDVEKLGRKIDSVEKFVFGQKAIQKFKIAFWGIFSGIIGTILALLTYVLLVAKNS